MLHKSAARMPYYALIVLFLVFIRQTFRMPSIIRLLNILQAKQIGSFSGLRR